MAEEKIVFKTDSIPTVYWNNATVSLSQADIRVYVAEISPSEMIATPITGNIETKPPRVEPRFCLVMSPEFARQVVKAIAGTLEQYEKVFGPLRPEVSQQQLDSKLKELSVGPPPNPTG